jgi:hypothetical protein
MDAQAIDKRAFTTVAEVRVSLFALVCSSAQ